MSKKSLFISLLLAFISGRLFATDTNVLEQINRAGEQRMLSQRIAKSFSLIGLNIQPFVAKQELDEATIRFEANLTFLAAINDEGAKLSLERLRSVWHAFRSTTRGVPLKTNAIWLSHKSDEVLAAAETLVRDLQNSAPNAARASGRLLAQAERQRMLSQRIVKTYLLVSWGDDSEVTRDELDVSINEFAGALNNLRQRTENTPAVMHELEEMNQHWEWMNAALSSEGTGSYRLIVAEAGEAILQSADRLTQLFAAGR